MAYRETNWSLPRDQQEIIERQNIFDLVARINHHSFTGDFVPDDGAVAVQRTHGKDFVNHGGESSGIVFGRQSSVVSGALFC